jgi:hypothetical protein
MSDYPPGAALFLFSLFACAVVSAVCIVAGGDPASIRPATLLVWSILGVFSESFSVYIPRGKIYISTVEAIFFAAYLSGGAPTALICIAATVLFRIQRKEGGLSHLFSVPFRLTLFNLCLYFVACDRCYTFLRNLSGGLRILPALVTAPFFLLFSCVLNVLFYKLEERRPFLNYLKEIFGPYYADALPASLGAVIIAPTYPRYGLVSALFFLTPIFVARLKFIDRTKG